MKYTRTFPNNIRPFTNTDFCDECDLMKEVEDLHDGTCGDCMEKAYAAYINGDTGERYTAEELAS